MRGVRSVVAARRTHRKANTAPWIIFNSFLSSVFDAVDLSIALSIRPFVQPRRAADRALDAFKRILRRRAADIEVHQSGIIASHFEAAILQLAAIRALRILYPHCENTYNLPYLDFIYYQASRYLPEHPIVDIIWNSQERLQELCSPESACIVLALHNGFANITRALSRSEKKIANVIGVPERISIFYRRNKIINAQDIEIVPVNRHTLLTLTKIAKQRKAIVCAPDYINPETGNCDFVSLGMFRLAQSTRVPLYFADYVIDERGLLRGFIEGPIEIKADIRSMAQDFVSFCRSVSGRRLSIE